MAERLSKKTDSVSLTIWRRLSYVDRFTLGAISQTGSRTGWSGKGWGEVCVDAGEGWIRFAESGRLGNGRLSDQHAVTNAYLWQRFGEGITLAHERSGRDNPKHLVTFVVDDNASAMTSTSPHQCKADAYRATLAATDLGLRLVWTIRGPNKNDVLTIDYTVLSDADGHNRR